MFRSSSSIRVRGLRYSEHRWGAERLGWITLAMVSPASSRSMMTALLARDAGIIHQHREVEAGEEGVDRHHQAHLAVGELHHACPG